MALLALYYMYFANSAFEFLNLFVVLVHNALFEDCT